MRVIAGTARRLLLKTLPGMEIRPTTDITKETLFNVLSPYIADARFLDLFGGSGAIGIEALSRGAKEAVFVEKNRDCAECIEDNLEHTHLRANAHIIISDVLTAISTLEYEKKFFDVIFMDPPYNKQLEQEVLLRLKKSSILNSETVIIVEASKETEFDYLKDTDFYVFKVKEYKTNKHVFIEKSEDRSE